MSLVVNHNLMAMNAARNLTTVFGMLGKSTERLSSGLRVSSAADDAAGLAVREIMRADIAVLNQGIRNASDAISLIQTAEGAMSVIDEKLIRMKELAEQAATGTYTTAQRLIMDSEYQAMAAEIDRISAATEFNGIKLLDGSLTQQHNGSGLKVHFGTGNNADQDYYYVKINNMAATDAEGLRVGSSAQEEIYQTTDLDLGSTADHMDAFHTGVMGFQYSTDGGTTFETYGWMNVHALDTLDDIVNEINQGPSEYVDINFASASVDGLSFSIKGHTFLFDTSGGGAITVGVPTTLSTTVSASGSGATLALALQYAVNTATISGYIGAVAVVEGATVRIYNTDMGDQTGLMYTESISASTISFTQHEGGDNLITASAQLDDSGKYELRLTMTADSTSYGARQLRLVNSLGQPLEASGSNTTVAAGTTIASMITAVNSFSALNSFTFNASSWEQISNGSGAADWAGANILTQSAAQQALGALDTAIQAKDTARAGLGAFQNRLENTITNLQIQAENLQAAESRISDVDVALEMTEFTKNNILAQAAVAMLAQANSLPQLALQLLGG